MEDFDKITKKTKVLKTIKQVVIYTLLSFWAVMILFPFYWMIMTSFKSFMEYNNESVPYLFIRHITFENFNIDFTKIIKIAKIAKMISLAR